MPEPPLLTAPSRTPADVSHGRGDAGWAALARRPSRGGASGLEPRWEELQGGARKTLLAAGGHVTRRPRPRLARRARTTPRGGAASGDVSSRALERAARGILAPGTQLRCAPRPSGLSNERGRDVPENARRGCARAVEPEAGARRLGAPFREDACRAPLPAVSWPSPSPNWLFPLVGPLGSQIGPQDNPPPTPPLPTPGSPRRVCSETSTVTRSCRHFFPGGRWQAAAGSSPRLNSQSCNSRVNSQGSLLRIPTSPA